MSSMVFQKVLSKFPYFEFETYFRFDLTKLTCSPLDLLVMAAYSFKFHSPQGWGIE